MARKTRLAGAGTSVPNSRSLDRPRPCPIIPAASRSGRRRRFLTKFARCAEGRARGVGYPEQPGSKRRRLLEVLQRHESPDERILHDVLAVDDRSHETRGEGRAMAGCRGRARPVEQTLAVVTSKKICSEIGFSIHRFPNRYRAQPARAEPLLHLRARFQPGSPERAPQECRRGERHPHRPGLEDFPAQSRGRAIQRATT
jgi:hypothetical protein